MSYMDRKWDFANCISYLYNAFAGLTDGKITKEEREEMSVCLSEWLTGNKYHDDDGNGYDLNNDEVSSLIDKTLDWFHTDINEEGEDVVRGACSCVAKVSRKNLNLDDCIGLADDLIRIARADGHFHENEKAWITEMALIMGFSFDNLENWSGIILHE